MSTQTMGDVIINMRANDVSMSSGLGGVNQQLEGIRHSLHGFQDLTQLAFGFHAGRLFFEKIHEGFQTFGEGFKDALSGGEDLGHALEAGAQHLFGMKTAAEEFAEHMKQAAEAGEKIAAIREIGESFNNAGTPDYERELDKKIDEAQKKVKELTDKAAPGYTEIAALVERRDEEKANGGQNLLNTLLAGGNLDEQVNAALKKHGPEMEAVNQAEKELQRVRAEGQEWLANKIDEDGNAQYMKQVDRQNAINAATEKAEQKLREEKLKTQKAVEAEQKDEDDRARKMADAVRAENERMDQRAGKIKDDVNPLRSFYREAFGVEDLFDKGKITSAEREKEFKRLQDAAVDKQHPTFQSLDQMARSIQESIGKPESLKPTIDQTNTILKQIRDGKIIATLA